MTKKLLALALLSFLPSPAHAKVFSGSSVVFVNLSSTPVTQVQMTGYCRQIFESEVGFRDCGSASATATLKTSGPREVIRFKPFILLEDVDLRARDVQYWLSFSVFTDDGLEHSEFTFLPSHDPQAPSVLVYFGRNWALTFTMRDGRNAEDWIYSHLRYHRALFHFSVDAEAEDGTVSNIFDYEGYTWAIDGHVFDEVVQAQGNGGPSAKWKKLYAKVQVFDDQGKVLGTSLSQGSSWEELADRLSRSIALDIP